MRVTHVITRLIVGGAQENTVASVLGLRQKPDLEVSLISGPTFGPEGSLETAFDSIPGMLRVLPELVRPVRPWTDLVALSKLTRVLRSEAPMLVHTHSGKAGVLGRLAAAKAGVPIIVHTIHGPSFGSFLGPAANTIYRGAERLAARKTTHFVVVADAMREQYLAAGIGSVDQYTTVLSGFDLDPFLNAKDDPALRQRLGIRPDDIVVGKVARLTALKGHEDLLQVAPAVLKACPRVKFLLVGDGDLRQQIETRARALGVRDAFVFTGLVQPPEVPLFVGITDVLVHLSRREGLPRALPQALAASKPVVAYDCDGAREVCLENKTGFLLPVGEHAGLVRRLEQLVGDRGLRSRLGNAGREFVAARFGVQKMVDDLHALYLRLARR
jgi:glycosyltransferase involved in cell wall biosynthesis